MYFEVAFEDFITAAAGALEMYDACGELVTIYPENIGLSVVASTISGVSKMCL